MERYEAYKDSGVEWIGEVPSHWSIHPLGAHSTMIVPMRDKPTRFDGDIPWIRIEDFDGKYISTSKSEQNVSNELIEEMNLKVYPVNTVLCSCSCNLGVCAIVDKPLCSNQTFIGCVPAEGELDPRFLFYLMGSMDRRLNYLSSGTIQTYLSRHDFEHLSVQVPPISEQQAIADYLDAKTDEIDALVADCEREVGLLQEYRKAVISEAVTKGLDPDAPMKDSGVEWIGEIPEGWALGRMGDVASYKKGPFGSSLTLSMFVPKEDSAAKVYEQKNAIQQDAELGHYYIDAVKYRELESFSVLPGDVIVSCAGTIGKCFVMPKGAELGVINQALMRIRLNEGLDLDYFLALFEVALDVMHKLYSNGSAIKNIPPFSVLKPFKIPFPPLEDQRSIACSLAIKTAEIDSLIEAKRSMADKLREYRKSLISEAVTGKFKAPGV